MGLQKTKTRPILTPGRGKVLMGMENVMGLEPYPLMRMVRHCNQLTAIFGGYCIHELVRRTFPDVSPDPLRAIIYTVLYCRDSAPSDEETRATVGLGPGGPKTFSIVARDRDPSADANVRVEKVKVD